MKFYSQNDLINYWEGGKSYKQMTDEGEVTIVSDPVRTIPYVTQKFFEVKKYHDEGKGRRWIKARMGAEKNDVVLADTRYKVIYKGGRSQEENGVFLHTFIDDCLSLWEEPIR